MRKCLRNLDDLDGGGCAIYLLEHRVILSRRLCSLREGLAIKKQLREGGYSVDFRKSNLKREMKQSFFL